MKHQKKNPKSLFFFTEVRYTAEISYLKKKKPRRGQVLKGSLNCVYYFMETLLRLVLF